MTFHDFVTLLPSLVQLATIGLIGFGLWLFREPLRELLGRLRRGKGPGFEFELSEVRT